MYLRRRYRRRPSSPLSNHGRARILRDEDVLSDPPTLSLSSRGRDSKEADQDERSEQDDDTTMSGGDTAQKSNAEARKEVVFDSDHIDLLGIWFVKKSVNGTMSDGMRKPDAQELRQYRRAIIKGIEEGLSSVGQREQRFAKIWEKRYA